MKILRSSLAGPIIVLSMAIFAMPLTAGAQATDAFAGTWRIALAPNEDASRDGAKTFEDAMVFEDGTLLTENFAVYGFNPGAYAVPEAAPTQFTATLQSNTKGKLDWSGSISGCQIRGTMTWTKADGKVWRFAFTGTKAN